jgi:hypothetical protein
MAKELKSLMSVRQISCNAVHGREIGVAFGAESSFGAAGEQNLYFCNGND